MPTASTPVHRRTAPTPGLTLRPANWFPQVPTGPPAGPPPEACHLADRAGRQPPARRPRPAPREPGCHAPGGRPGRCLSVEERPLSPHERGEVRARLVAERAQVRRQLASLQHTFDELVAAADLEPPDDEHDPEGTTAYERAQVISLAEAARRRLDDLDRALAAVDDDRFGSCERCGRPIGRARLEALPATRRCVACASGHGP